jgi:hypothetical protein
VLLVVRNKSYQEEFYLRKSFIAAGATALAIGVAGVAYAQAPAVTVTAKLSPTKAGTSSKPANEKFTLSVKNDPASKTTAKSIAITFPSTLKVSTKGLPQCTASDDSLINSGGSVCKKDKAGSGTAHAVLIANGTNVTFNVTAFVGKNEMLFYLTSASGNFVTHGKLSGKKMTITIGPTLQQPAPGLYAALIDLSTTLSMKSGKNYLISSTGCKSKAQKIGVVVGYAPNPAPPSVPSASGSASAKCS